MLLPDRFAVIKNDILEHCQICFPIFNIIEVLFKQWEAPLGYNVQKPLWFHIVFNI